MNFPLLIYRISGWAVNLTMLLVAIAAIRSKNIWKGKYLFLGIQFCCLALIELVSSITALVLTNNLFLDYIYIITVFSTKTGFLSQQHNSKIIRIFGIVCVITFVIFQINKAIGKNGFEEFNAFGAYGSAIFFMLFSFFNLRILIKQKNSFKKLRNNPDFWFTATIFCFSFLGILITVLTDVSYAAKSDLVLYALFIFENIIKTILYLGYFRGIKLLEKL